MNRWSDVVFLIGIIESTDADGFPVIVPGVPREVYANKKSVRSTEFHAAKQQGITLSNMFEVRIESFEGEERLTYEDKEYTIYRTYEKGEFIELVCQKVSDTHAP